MNKSCQVGIVEQISEVTIGITYQQEILSTSLNTLGTAATREDIEATESIVQKELALLENLIDRRAILLAMADDDESCSQISSDQALAISLKAADDERLAQIENDRLFAKSINSRLPRFAADAAFAAKLRADEAKQLADQRAEQVAADETFAKSLDAQTLPLAEIAH